MNMYFVCTCRFRTTGATLIRGTADICAAIFKHEAVRTIETQPVVPLSVTLKTMRSRRHKTLDYTVVYLNCT